MSVKNNLKNPSRVNELIQNVNRLNIRLNDQEHRIYRHLQSLSSLFEMIDNDEAFGNKPLSERIDLIIENTLGQDEDSLIEHTICKIDRLSSQNTPNQLTELSPRNHFKNTPLNTRENQVISEENRTSNLSSIMDLEESSYRENSSSIKNSLKNPSRVNELIQNVKRLNIRLTDKEQRIYRHLQSLSSLFEMINNDEAFGNKPLSERIDLIIENALGDDDDRMIEHTICKIDELSSQNTPNQLTSLEVLRTIYQKIQELRPLERERFSNSNHHEILDIIENFYSTMREQSPEDFFTIKDIFFENISVNDLNLTINRLLTPRPQELIQRTSASSSSSENPTRSPSFFSRIFRRNPNEFSTSGNSASTANETNLTHEINRTRPVTRPLTSEDLTTQEDHEIIPGLYLGPQEGSNDYDLIVAATVHERPSNDARRIQWPASPHTNEDVGINDFYNQINNLEEIHRQITNALATGQKVLIHCQQGKDRSATLTAAYLMNRFRVSAEKALNYIKSKRIIADPMDPYKDFLNEYSRRI